jgi:pSer/pThr/pTyr-binding forkhead associated (FHA) protein
MQWALVVDRGGHKGRIIPIRTSPLAIGRDDDCQLRTSNPYVSHRHCELLTEGDKVILRDCNSTNGTFINDQRIDKEAELHEGDRLQIGAMRFVVKQAGNDADHEVPAPRLQAASAPPKSHRRVDEDAIGEMLLEMDEKAEENRAAPGSWRKPKTEESKDPSPPLPPKSRGEEKEFDPPAAKVASKMLKGKGDWLKRKPGDSDS